MSIASVDTSRDLDLGPCSSFRFHTTIYIIMCVLYPVPCVPAEPALPGSSREAAIIVVSSPPPPTTSAQ